MVTRGKPTIPAVAPQQQDHTSPVVYQELPPRPPGPSSAKEALDLFYLSLCAPAFPHPGMTIFKTATITPRIYQEKRNVFCSYPCCDAAALKRGVANYGRAETYE